MPFNSMVTVSIVSLRDVIVFPCGYRHVVQFSSRVRYVLLKIKPVESM